MVCLFDHLTADDGSLALCLLDFLEFVSLRARFVLHVDKVVSCTTVALHAYLVLVAHSIVPTLLVLILVLHVLPPPDISLHLGQSPRLNQRLLLQLFLLPLLPIVIRKILRVPVQRMAKVARLWVRMVQLRIINELVIAPDILSLAQLVYKLLILAHLAVIGHDSLLAGPGHSPGRRDWISLIHRMGRQPTHI